MLQSESDAFYYNMSSDCDRNMQVRDTKNNITIYYQINRLIKNSVKDSYTFQYEKPVVFKIQP